MNELTSQAQEALEALRAKVAHRREYLDILEMELTNTRIYLQEFSDEYRERVGPLEAELSRLEHILEENTQPMPPNAHPNGGGSQSTKKEAPEEKSSKKQATKKFTSKKKPDYERKIRELFRNLAKRFHPDLAENASEKEEREAIMTKINQAYTARDLKALEELARDSAALGDSHSSAPEAEYARLKLELRHLETMIFEVEHTIRELDLSPVMQMRSEAQSEEKAGRDLLADMAFDLKLRIAELREHLLDLGLDVKADPLKN